MIGFKMRTLVKYFFFFAVLIEALASCTEDARQSLRAVPNAYGKVNSITIIADKALWEGPVGDTLRYYYSSAYLILPQPEPLFDLIHYTVEDITKESIRKETRNNIILANLSDANSPTTQLVLQDLGTEKARRAKEDSSFNTVIGKDKWANGQLIVYQFAYSDDQLIGNIKKNFPAISRRFNKADEVKIDATLFIDGENRKIGEEIRSKMDAQMRVPKDYFIALSNNEIIWVRKETQKYSSNLILKKIPYTDQSQLTREGIKSVTDSIGRKYISSQIPDTYVKVNDVDLPMFVDARTINNNYALEARGIWEMENDFMGGPFISFLFYNPEKKELLFVEGFVYAPTEDKRDYIQNLQYIISTVRY